LIDGGNIDIQHSDEGIEAAQVVVKGGTIRITAIDDGISTITRDIGDTRFIYLVGGNITINCIIGVTGKLVEALDANGTLVIAGGTIIANSSGIYDVDNGTLMTGGTVYGINAGYYEKPAANSTQPTIILTTSRSAGTKITVKDTLNGTVAEFTTGIQCDNLTISVPQFVLGGEYSIWVNDTQVTSVVINYITTETTL
jgi:hypothetical protein